VLVANAGSGYPGAIEQLGAEAWEFCFRLNVVGTALCTKHAAERMKRHGGGSVIGISSTSGTKVQPWLAAYVVSKAALDMFVRCAAIELSPHAIRVNSIQPGYVATETMQSATSDELHATLRRATPLPREGTAADVGHAVAFLASDDASWITGQDFGVDGGMNIPVMPSMAAIAENLYGPEVVAQVGLPDFTALNVVEG
jgi:3alpha(or 20beta)-hydroxysteroid dehydrogenase